MNRKKWQAKVDAAAVTPKARELQRDISRAVNAYRQYFEEMGLQVIVGLGPLQEDDGSGDVIKWQPIQRREVH
jgi:hypothetical protein